VLIVPNLRGLQVPCHVSVTYCSNKNTEANRFNDLPAEPCDSAATSRRRLYHFGYLSPNGQIAIL